mmetsp:Transcript_21067/g.66226  ORF Transcript_21067/g.66226 Transcript_21067/m.66226 type:complete len:465 (-) Transcript_21067:231-1625(-)
MVAACLTAWAWTTVWYLGWRPLVLGGLRRRRRASKARVGSGRGRSGWRRTMPQGGRLRVFESGLLKKKRAPLLERSRRSSQSSPTANEADLPRAAEATGVSSGESLMERMVTGLQPPTGPRRRTSPARATPSSTCPKRTTPAGETRRAPWRRTRVASRGWSSGGSRRRGRAASAARSASTPSPVVEETTRTEASAAPDRARTSPTRSTARRRSRGETASACVRATTTVSFRARATPRCSAVMRRSAASRASTTSSAASGDRAVRPNIVVFRYFSRPARSTRTQSRAATSAMAEVVPSAATSCPCRSTAARADPRPSSSAPVARTPIKVDFPALTAPITHTRGRGAASDTSRRFTFANSPDASTSSTSSRRTSSSSHAANEASSRLSLWQQASTRTSATRPFVPRLTRHSATRAPSVRVIARSVASDARSSRSQRPSARPSSRTPTRYKARPPPSFSRNNSCVTR